MTVKDETYVFIQDVKDKKITARSARHTRTHCGKGGKVRFPSDNLSKKELMKMNGECKSYRLNDPMAWKEFKAMPDDIKVTYIKLLREKFGCPDSKIGEMMGASKDQISMLFKKLGLNNGKTRKRTGWDKEGFYAWMNGVDKLPAPVLEEEPVPEEKEAVITEEPEIYADEDIPWSVPDPVPYDPIHEKCMALEVENKELNARIDELLKCNEELMAVHKKDKERISWLELRVDELGQERHILERQMDVVRLIFGGKNNG